MKPSGASARLNCEIYTFKNSGEKLMRNLKIVIFVLLLTALPAFAADIKNGEQLIAAMHKKYAGKWYKTLTFVQKTTRHKPDGTTQVTTWYEAMSVPGRLRVDIEPLGDGNGFMFLDNTQYAFSKGKLANNQPRVHPLLVLGFDVYAQPVDKTVTLLKSLDMDLSVLHTEMWQGREVYVVGAKQGDLNAPQFWIDKKNLYFVRLIELAGKDKKQVHETQFNKYYKVKGGGWVSPEVIFNVDGKLFLTEEYTDVQTDVKLDEALFNPQKWSEVEKTYYKKN
jgi:outer membrane lipoprotein-sorting protein